MILSIFQKFVMNLERKERFEIERNSCKVLNSDFKKHKFLI